MIRRAIAADGPRVARIVADAYAPLAERMASLPGPMLDDYPARIAEGVVDVFETDGQIAGFVICHAVDEAYLLENVAVAPEAQGRGIGRALIGHAEALAARAGVRRIRLYTHITMVENQTLYRRLGYRETGRGLEDGFDRVQFAKDLAA